MPREVNGYALAVVDGEIYVAGGCCANREDLFVFDGVAWRTEDADMLTPPRDHLAGVGVEGTFMALGGYDWPDTSTRSR